MPFSVRRSRCDITYQCQLLRRPPRLTEDYKSLTLHRTIGLWIQIFHCPRAIEVDEVSVMRL
jgi:hypothetical protein